MYITKIYLSVGIKHKLFVWTWIFLSSEFSQSINVCRLLWTKFYLEVVYIQIFLLNCYFILKENLKLIIRPANTIRPVSLTTSPVEGRRYESFRKYEEFLCHCYPSLCLAITGPIIGILQEKKSISSWVSNHSSIDDGFENCVTFVK